MTSVEIVDRSGMVARMMDLLELEAGETAIVAVDMHRGHLDMEVATMPASPEDAARVIAQAGDLLGYARGKGIPVVHVVLTNREIPGLGDESQSAPFWAAMARLGDETDRLAPGRKSTASGHNIVGSRGTEIIPDLHDPSDYVINNKKRLDCFFGTDLDSLLGNLGVKTVCLMGINTNTCILNTAFTAHNKNYKVVVLSDCVASMYGDDLHRLGLENVKRCLGWVLSNDEFRAKIEG